jgi:hypothetical protein
MFIVYKIAKSANIAIINKYAIWDRYKKHDNKNGLQHHRMQY